MKKTDWYINPYIIFLPFLILYLLLIGYFSTEGLPGDESRYIMFAENLAKGFYSPRAPFIDLGNGPGYPILITPFIALNISYIFIKLMNGVLYYFSVVFLFKSLRLLVPYLYAIIFSVIWAIYPAFFERMTSILPEVFVATLMTLLIYTSLKTYFTTGKSSLKYIIISGVTLGYIALTKPIFGYVIMCLLAGIFVLWILNRKNVSFRKNLYILIIAFVTTIPYLVYTWGISGKIFYWSSFGGNNLYWMSSPSENEFGDWMGYPADPEDIYKIPGSETQVKANHKKDFDFLLQNESVRQANVRGDAIEYNLTKGITQDELFKSIALQNIKNHPVKFLKNCIANVGRMLFNYPYSYTIQKDSTLYRLPLNGTIVLLSVFCMIISLIRWRQIFYPIRFILFMIAIYFGGSILGSADTRMFFPMVPVLFIWISYIIHRSIRINLDLNP